MPINSKKKGNRVQRQGCKYLQSLGLGIKAQRTQQYCGNSGDSSDIRTNYPGLRFQIKGGYDKTDVASSAPVQWVEKCIKQMQNALMDQYCVVLWKRSRKKWLAVYQSSEGVACFTSEVKELLDYIIDTYKLERDQNFEYTQQQGRKAGGSKDS